MSTTNQLTLRKLLDRIKQQGNDVETVMDYPLAVGVYDHAGNFVTVTIRDDWPRTFKHDENSAGQLRLDVTVPKYMRNLRGQS